MGLLASKSESCNRNDVFAVTTPGSTATHYPIPHGRLLETIEGALDVAGYHVADEGHALSGDNGAKYFGLLEVTRNDNDLEGGDYRVLVGVRNSHDKSIAAGLAIGSRVLVCSNMSFSGEVTLTRRHTLNIASDLDSLVNKAFGRLTDMRRMQDKRFEAYRQHELSDARAAEFILRSIRGKAASGHQAVEIWNEWLHPTYEAFESRTMWSLFNAYTHAYKGLSASMMAYRSQRLHGAADLEVGLVA